MGSYARHTGERLMEIYTQLHGALGESQWWPANSALEVIIGAVLTQNTAWGNVEKALANLSHRNLLPTGTASQASPTVHEEKTPPETNGISPVDAGRELLALPEEELAELIRPAGFYRLKARRLRSVLTFFDDVCAFDLSWLATSHRHDNASLRRALLKVGGVGPETADDILLYALKRPSFVVDAYTMRLFGRHSLLPASASYENVRSMFMDALPVDVNLYSEFHSHIVCACKTWCRKKNPLCPECPLGRGLWAWKDSAENATGTAEASGTAPSATLAS